MKSALWKELTCLRRDGRLRVTAILFALLLVGAVALGVVENRAYEKQRQAASDVDRDLWMEQGEKDPHSAAHYGQYLFRPRSGLHWMDRGADDHLGTTTFLEAHHLGKAQNAPVESRPWAPPLVDLSPSNLVLVILPLLALILGHGVWNGERATGTLATTVAAGADPRKLLRGKVVSILVVTGGLTAVASVMGLVGLLFQDVSLSDGLARLGLLVAAYTASTVLYTLVGVLASAAIRSPARSLLAVLAFWAVTMVLAPRVMNSIANQLHPLPDKATIDVQIKEMRENGINGDDPRSERRARLRKEVLAEYGVENMKDLPINYAGIALQKGEEYDNAIFDRIEGRIEEVMARRDSVREWAYFLSPSAAARALSRLAAGSDHVHHEWFEARAEEYRRSYVKALNDDVAFKPERVGTEALWKKTAIAPVTAAPLGELMLHSFVPSVALLNWAIVLLILMSFVWRRADRDPVRLGG